MKIFKKLGIKPVNINLYYQAFTHTSFSYENPSYDHYERLEFLGDSILYFIVSEYLYKGKHLEEGEMTEIRKRYICEPALATYARDLKFEDDIKLGNVELGHDVKDSIMADVFEAFIAALYLDLGMDLTKEIILKIIVKYIDDDVDFIHDYKSKLDQLVRTDKDSVKYKLISETGPAHNKTFVTEVIVNGIVLGSGTGTTKKASEQMAAKEALSKQAK